MLLKADEGTGIHVSTEIHLTYMLISWIWLKIKLNDNPKRYLSMLLFQVTK